MQKPNREAEWIVIDWIPGYENLYLLSDLGDVYSIRSKKLLTPSLVGTGHKDYQVTFTRDYQSKHFKVHRLVAQGFIPNPNNLETVNHIDEDTSHNWKENLEWMTRRDNIAYSSGKPVEVWNKDKTILLNTFDSISASARYYNISRCTLRDRITRDGGEHYYQELDLVFKKIDKRNKK